MYIHRAIGIAAVTFILATAFPYVGRAEAAGVRAPLGRSTIFAGTQGGAVYRSTDGGYSWQESDTGLPSGTDILSLAVAPSNSNVIYAGTSREGISVSTDGGSNWGDDNGGNYDLAGASIKGVAVDPRNANHVCAVSTDGTFYDSSDGGSYWSGTSLPSSPSVTAFALNPRDPSTLLVGTSDGIYRSGDSGYTWSVVGYGSVSDIAFSPFNAAVAFAATTDGMWQTIDSGMTWQAERRGIPTGMTFQSLAVDPANGARIVAGSLYGDLYRSVDGGTSWSNRGSAHGPTITAILFDPARKGAVIAATTDGSQLFMSGDYGASWSAIHSSIGNSILALAASSTAPLPTSPVPPPLGHPAGVQYVTATHHIMSGPFLSFYNRYGGLKIFGLPLTEQFSESGHAVQYFERSRLVLVNGQVTLTALGSQLTAGRRFPAAACCASTGQLWFQATRHTLANPFLQFWVTHNGSLLFGSPISQPLYEQNGDGTGRTYLVQYFQNARMEYHPELAGTANVVTLGQLGRQVLHQRGWL